MFKERFPQNYLLYSRACKAGEVHTGAMFVTATDELDGPKWIVNFPTKQHWRGDSRIEWIEAGLADLRNWIELSAVESIALPPLGAGNGGLDWNLVHPLITRALSGLEAEIIVYEPTTQYQNVEKRSGVQRLTPARALITELVHRYAVMGMDCSLLEIQKLAWFLERAILRRAELPNTLNLEFRAHLYGPYAPKLSHLLNSLDGSYLHSDKRIGDANPMDTIWIDRERVPLIQAYLQSEAKMYATALEEISVLIDGFQSPFGMELLATCDWLLHKEKVEPSIAGIRNGLANWSAGEWAAQRKSRIFHDDEVLTATLGRLQSSSWNAYA
ncbi:O-acetyl-ADP-ribose deacetylase (regulator of RNase III) [Comamonas sp. BIGb0152]|nr:O-acetyl-ADP-ribose deacetylase (regulator of RNase III) [Comamonas sp. BIGb0152]